MAFSLSALDGFFTVAALAHAVMHTARQITANGVNGTSVHGTLTVGS